MTLKLALVKGTWVYVIPVSGLRLTGVVKEEITLDQVTFISVRKLINVRKRLGIPQPISKLRMRYSMIDFLATPNQVVAVTRHTGKPHEIDAIVRKRVTEALWLLSASQLGLKKRRYSSFPVIGSTTARSYIQLCLNISSNGGICTGGTAGKTDDLITDRFWVDYNKQMFFGNLISVLNGSISVASSWKDTLRRVALLAGQSQSSSDIAHAFLLNMIAIEALLVEQQDKHKNALPKRVEAFIGWVGYWSTHSYEQRLSEVYSKRCKLVHNGVFEDIEIRDLLFTDDILLNVLANILNHLSVFKSKRSIIDFSDKIAAAKMLGLDPQKIGVRPRSLFHVSRRYTESDLTRI